MNTLLLLVQIALSSITAVHALVYKRDSRSALSWIVISFILPFIGPFFYYAFGINRVAYRAKHLANKEPLGQHLGFKKFTSLSSDENEHQASQLPVEVMQSKFGAVSNKIAASQWTQGNRVSVLINGDETYPEMLSAIASAKQNIYLMTYIFNTDSFGKNFIKALADAKNRGVEVKVMVDGIAYMYSLPSANRLLTKAGISNVKFNTGSLFPPSFGINLRNHKKLLLIDSEIAFTGGMNIAGINLLKDPQNKKPKQDTHFKLSGPVVSECYKVFADSWYFLTEELIDVPASTQKRFGNALCKLVNDGPDEEMDKIDLILIDAIMNACESVEIMTPYFIPSREFISALNNAALRGVRVEIILPIHSDSKLVDYATRNMLWELLQRGVKVYYQPGPFDHSKIFIIDTEYTVIGSANIDPRSLRLNYELIIELFDGETVNTLSCVFNQKRSISKLVDLQELENRPLLIRIRDSICWLFSPYL